MTGAGPRIGHAARCATLACGLFLVAGAGQAAPLFNDSERAALGAEVRALLLEEPDLVDRAMNPPSAFQEAVSADVDRLTRLAPRLFDPARDGFGPVDAALRIALFVRDDCDDCAQATTDLRNLAATHDLRVTLFSLSGAGATEAAALAAALELTDSPAYVLPDMMLQGHIPPVIMERYLAR